jgi:hypothetical protein
MEAKEIVFQLIRSEIEEVDLVSHPQARSHIFNLAQCQVRPPQDRLEIESSRLCARVSQAGYGAASSRMRARKCRITITHEIASHGPVPSAGTSRQSFGAE